MQEGYFVAVDVPSEAVLPAVEALGWRLQRLSSRALAAMPPAGDSPGLPLLAVAATPSTLSIGKIAQKARLAGLPLVPIMLDNLTLQIGPIVDPSTGPCFECYLLRRLQHRNDPVRELRERQIYQHGRNGTVNPAAITSAVAGFAAHALATGREHAGQYWRVTLPPGDVGEGRVTAVHGCEECADIDPAGGRATAAALTAYVAGWTTCRTT